MFMIDTGWEDYSTVHKNYECLVQITFMGPLHALYFYRFCMKWVPGNPSSIPLISGLSTNISPVYFPIQIALSIIYQMYCSEIMTGDLDG